MYFPCLSGGLCPCAFLISNRPHAQSCVQLLFLRPSVEASSCLRYCSDARLSWVTHALAFIIQICERFRYYSCLSMRHHCCNSMASDSASARCARLFVRAADQSVHPPTQEVVSLLFSFKKALMTQGRGVTVRLADATWKRLSLEEKACWLLHGCALLFTLVHSLRGPHLKG